MSVRRLAAVAALSPLLVGLAACGSGSASSAAPSPTRAASSPSHPAVHVAGAGGSVAEPFNLAELHGPTGVCDDGGGMLAYGYGVTVRNPIKVIHAGAVRPHNISRIATFYSPSHLKHSGAQLLADRHSLTERDTRAWNWKGRKPLAGSTIAKGRYVLWVQMWIQKPKASLAGVRITYTDQKTGNAYQVTGGRYRYYAPGTKGADGLKC